MKLSLKLRASALAAALIATSVASATPTGTFSIGIVTGGSVTVTATTIDWQPPTGAGYGEFATGEPTSVSYDDGSGPTTLTSTTNPFGRILDLTFAPGSVPNFIQWYDAGNTLPLQDFPVFDLTQVFAGGSAQGVLDDCAGVTAVGVSCSPLIGGAVVSPFVLTNRPTGVDVSLSVELLGRDATGEVPWFGGFTTQISGTNASQIQAVINTPGGFITNTYSATFTSIPEPGTYALLGSGLLLVGFARRRFSKR